MQALETETTADDRQWLTYWTVYAAFNCAEYFSDRILSFLPFYFGIKLAFLVWSFHPSTRYAAPICAGDLFTGWSTGPADTPQQLLPPACLSRTGAPSWSTHACSGRCCSATGRRWIARPPAWRTAPTRSPATLRTAPTSSRRTRPTPRPSWTEASCVCCIRLQRVEKRERSRKGVWAVGQRRRCCCRREAMLYLRYHISTMRARFIFFCSWSTP